MARRSPVEVRGTATSLDDLYRRHSGEAWRVAFSITRNRDDAADAVAEAFTRVMKALTGDRLGAVDDVRPYLMVATRNAALDVVRKAGRVVPTDEPGDEEAPAAGGPSDQLVAGEDRNLVAEALAGLPPRWQAVLWLTEVEGMPPREVADLLRLSPNNVAQLAARARSRLRQRYVQSHVRNHASGDCLWTVERLGGLATGELTEQRATRVRAHLAECADCRARLAELDDLGLSLRRAAVPAALLLGRRRPRLRDAWFGRARTSFSAPSPTTVGTANRLAGLVGSPVGQGVAVTVAAGVVALGVGTAVLRRDAATPGTRRPGVEEGARGPAATAPAATVPAAAVIPGAVLDQAGPTTSAAASASSTSTSVAPSTTTTAVLAAAAPATRPVPFTPRGPLATALTSTVATAEVPEVLVYDSPGGTPRLALASPLPTGAPLVLLVTEVRADWFQVLLPVRPNGSTGWVRRDQVGVSTHTFRIVVELGAHRLTAYHGTEVLLSEPIGVGRAEVPTPGGLYYTTDLVRPANAAGNDDPTGPYGTYAYPLSGFSEVLFDFAGGDGQFGIHGTNDPSGLGRDVSHGCIRMSNEGISFLAPVLPLGVPVEILA